MPTGWVSGRSPGWRVAAALLVLVDLAARAVARSWDVLPVDVLAPLFSLGLDAASDASDAAAALSLVLLAVVVFLFSESLYPARLGLRGDGPVRWRRPGFRLLVVAVALGYVEAFAHAASVGLLPRVLGVFAVSGVAFVGYLRWWTDWDLVSPSGDAVAMVDDALPRLDMRSERAADRARDGWRRTLADAIWLTWLGMALAFPAFFAGLAAVLLGRASPVPDLLLLGWVLAGTGWLPEEAADLEQRLYLAVGLARRSLKGVVLVLFAVVGLFLSVVLFSGALTGLSAALEPLVDATPGGPGLAWNRAGLRVVPLAVAGYWSWVWLRELDRIAGFLDGWEGRQIGAAGPARPPWLTLPPTAVLVGVSVGREALGGPAWSLAWPASVALLVGLARWTTRRQPGVPATEDRAVAAALAVQYAGVWLAGAVADRSLRVALVEPGLVFPVVAVFAATYLPDVVGYAGDHVGLRHYADVGYLLGFGVVTGALSLAARAGDALALGALATVCLVGGVAVGATRYLETTWTADADAE